MTWISIYTLLLFRHSLTNVLLKSSRDINDFDICFSFCAKQWKSFYSWISIKRTTQNTWILFVHTIRSESNEPTNWNNKSFVIWIIWLCKRLRMKLSDVELRKQLLKLVAGCCYVLIWMENGILFILHRASGCYLLPKVHLVTAVKHHHVFC